MDRAKGGGISGDGVGSGNANTDKIMSEGEAEALKKCLEENKGEESSRHANCKSKVEAFRSSPPSHPKNKPLGPLRLKSGSLTDV